MDQNETQSKAWISNVFETYICKAQSLLMTATLSRNLKLRRKIRSSLRIFFSKEKHREDFLKQYPWAFSGFSEEQETLHYVNSIPSGNMLISSHEQSKNLFT